MKITKNMLKQLSVKIKSPRYISEIENEPAYKRRNVKYQERKNTCYNARKELDTTQIK